MKTDVQKVEYPQGTSASDRRFVRKMIVAVAEEAAKNDFIVIACSAGMDSTILAHATGQALRIRPNNREGKAIQATACYINHQLRPDENEIEASHVSRINLDWLTSSTPAIRINVEKGPGLQARAREQRYAALQSVLKDWSTLKPATLWMAHTASDNVETKLFQFLKGKPVLGIPRSRMLDQYTLARPLLDFTRKDIERYAKCFRLSWCEDSSNEKDDYTRNKIRHHLIPWIENNINPGFISMMSKEN